MIPRPLIVAVALVVALFVLGIGLEGGQGDSSPPANEDSAISLDPPPILQSLGALLRPLSPRLELSPNPIRVNPLATVSVNLPASGDPFRIASLTLSQGNRAVIRFVGETSLPAELRELTLPASRTRPGANPREGVLVIPKEGGQLAITCGPVLACLIAVE